MMLYPAMGELNARIHNRYMLVNVVARRARQIAEAYEEAHQPLNEKPVTIAITEVADGILSDPEQAPPDLDEAEESAAPEPDEEEFSDEDEDDDEFPDEDDEDGEEEDEEDGGEEDAEKK